MDGCGSLSGAHSDNEREQRVEVGDGTTVANAGTFDAECFGRTVDAFAGSALGGNSVGERAGAIQQDAGATPRLVSAVLLAALAL